MAPVQWLSPPLPMGSVARHSLAGISMRHTPHSCGRGERAGRTGGDELPRPETRHSWAIVGPRVRRRGRTYPLSQSLHSRGESSGQSMSEWVSSLGHSGQPAESTGGGGSRALGCIGASRQWARRTVAVLAFRPGAQVRPALARLGQVLALGLALLHHLALVATRAVQVPRAASRRRRVGG